MTICVVKGCHNSSDKSNRELKFGFHQFPTDPVMRERWAEKLRLNRGDSYWKPTKNSKICSVHFDSSVKYTTEGGLAKLRRSAIPTKHLHINCSEDHSPHNHPHSHGEIRETQMPVTIVIKQEPQDTSEGESAVPAKGLYNNSSEVATAVKPEARDTNEASQNVVYATQTTHVTTNNVSFSSDDSLDSVYDSPGKAKIRKQLRKKTKMEVEHIKKIKSLQQKIRRLTEKNPSLKRWKRRKTNASLQQIIVNLRKERYINNDIFNILREDVTAAQLCNKIIRKARKSKNTFLPIPRYSPEFRKFCVTLNFYSSQAYKYALKAFYSGLPDAKITYNWYRNDIGSPGLTEEAFEILRSKVQSSDKKLLCALITDITHLQPQDNCDGSIDFGAGPSKSGMIATEVCTFVLVCLNGEWAIPLGYFLVNGLNGSQIKNLVSICLTKCDEAGVKVTSITLAANGTSISAAQLLGCRLNNPENMKTTFKHPTGDHEVALFFDREKIQKLIKEHLFAKKVLIDQDQNKIDMLSLPKADQLFFNESFGGRTTEEKELTEHSENQDYVCYISLANEVKVCREDRNLDDFKNSEATDQFLKMLINLTHILFCSSPDEEAEGLWQPLSSANKQEIFDYLEKSKKYILNLQLPYTGTTESEIESKVAKSSIGYKGILVNLESLKHLYLTEVEGTKETNCIATQKLGHEPLKDLLKSIVSVQSRDGQCVDVPTALQFKNGYKETFLQAKSTGFQK